MPQSYSPKQVTQEQINLAIDITASMRGFSYTGTFQDLLRKNISSIGPSLSVKYYALDTTLTEIKDYLYFFEPKFFSGFAANFEKAFSAGKTNENEILIIITDLQFNDEKRYFELVKIFRTDIKRTKERN